VLHRFFGPISRHVYEELLDSGFQLAEQLRGDTAAPRTYGERCPVQLTEDSRCQCIARNSDLPRQAGPTGTPPASVVGSMRRPRQCGLLSHCESSGAQARTIGSN
jgi:hypothetical protein